MGNLSINSALNGATGSPGKVAAEAVSAAKSVEAQAAQQASAPPSKAAIVTSPKGVFDPESGLYLLQYLDQSTGEVTKQYPSEKVVDAYRRGSIPVKSSASSGSESSSAPSVDAGGEAPVAPSDAGTSSETSSGTTTSVSA